MTRPCPDVEPLLLDRVAGELDKDAESRLEGHLAQCAACRAELSALDETLALATLPPVSDAERAAVAGAFRSTLVEWKRSRRRRRNFAAGAAAVAVAAAALMFAVSPGLMRRSQEVSLLSPYWRVPDLDEVWSAAEIAEPSADPTIDTSADGTNDTPDDSLYAELDEVEY